MINRSIVFKETGFCDSVRSDVNPSSKKYPDRWKNLFEVSASAVRRKSDDVTVPPKDHLEDCEKSLNLIAQGMGDGWYDNFYSLCDRVSELKCSMQHVDSGVSNEVAILINSISSSNGMLWIVDGELDTALASAHLTNSSEAVMNQIVLLKGRLNQLFRDIVILTSQQSSQDVLSLTLSKLSNAAVGYTSEIIDVFRRLLASSPEEQVMLSSNEGETFRGISTSLLECSWALQDAASGVVGNKECVSTFSSCINDVIDGIDKAARLVQNPFVKPMFPDLATTVRDCRTSGYSYSEISSHVSRLASKSRESHVAFFKGAITDDNKTSSGILLCLAARQLLSELSPAMNHIWKGENTTGCLIDFIIEGYSDVSIFFPSSNLQETVDETH
eukprot:TRINITY_DN32377_c0_g1_i1.p1 TRINITY_DN32377_c0_g1~~TRINITY_DN32377_c0_g1_i1.p1  ORF type:complete len:387 (+),score=72.71 TRINITY_DN32377_c0_g1_i1:15-1175(+)